MPDIPGSVPAAVVQASLQQAQPNLVDAAKQAASKKKKPPQKSAAQLLYPSLQSAQDVGDIGQP